MKFLNRSKIVIKPEAVVQHLYLFVPIALFASMLLDNYQFFSMFVITDCCLLVLGLLIKKARESKAFYFYVPLIAFGLSAFSVPIFLN